MNRAYRPNQEAGAAWLIAAIFTFFICLGGNDASAQTTQAASRRVLVIYSDERLLPANVIIDNTIRKTFDANSASRTEFYSEFLDVTRFSGDAQDRRQRDFFRDKYGQRPPDLVIAAALPALKFLLNHRAELFTNVPIVFLEVTKKEVPAHIADPRVVGTPMAPDFTDTIALALHVHPDTKQIVVVTGVAPHDVEFANAARENLRAFEKRVTVRWLSNLSVQEVKQEVSRLPDHTVVLYLTMFQDQTGKSFLPREALAEFAPASRAPIYGIFDTYLGYGIVGGNMVTFETIARTAAEIGLGILAGKEPGVAAAEKVHQPTPIFDWHQLQRAHIPDDRLPPGSVVRFREYSIWERYRWYIIAIASVGLVQTLLIAGLLIHRRRRRHAEASLTASEAKYRQLHANMIDAFVSVDLDGRFQEFNEPFRAMLGYEREELMALTYKDVIPEKWHAMVTDVTAEVLLQGYSEIHEKEYRRKDGTVFPVELRKVLLRDGSGNPPAIWSLVRDITGRKQAEERLQGTLAELQQMKDQLAAENTYLRQEMKTLHRSQDIVGQSDALRRILESAEQVAPTPSSVLLLGETGTGKELLARAIHDLSPRRDKPMVCVNCAAIPTTLIESELFGREKGAYTGAMAKQIGRFEAADGSTIFLDEVGELPAEVQIKLLRVLQERQIERLGSPRTIPVNVRVIAATNRDLAKAVREGSFRQDLYYRLAVFPIQIPPLRDRREDIPLLAWSFIEEFSKSMGKPMIEGISKPDLDTLQQYDWPGNVRELRNVIERAMILANGAKLRVTLPHAAITTPAPASLSLQDSEREHILSVLVMTRWRVQGKGGAAEILGMKRTTLESRMAKLGIHRPHV